MPIAFGQSVVNGLLLGGIYAAVAVGFSLVWGITNIVNLAHGAFVMLGAYVVFWLFTLLHLDPFLALPVAMLVLFTLGWLVQTALINQILRAPLMMTLLLTFGLSLCLTDGAFQLWSASLRSINLPYGSAGLHIGLLVVPYVRLAALAVAIALTVALGLFLNRTLLGLAILATGIDQDAARLVGISPRRVYALTFAIGAALAGAAGGLVAIIYPISPTVGEPYVLQAFVVVVLGGIGNVFGALLGGLAFGLLEELSSSMLGSGYQDAVAFVVLVLVLIVRPRGLLGRALS